MSIARISRSLFCVCVVNLVFASLVQAQVFTTLVEFERSDGATPRAALVQGIDGNLYGTTYDGGADNGGTVFKITRAGQLTNLYSFPEGTSPLGSLTLTTEGVFYGTTAGGGSSGKGSVFRITPDGELTILYSFCSEANCSDGISSNGSLIQADDGTFYGTTVGGGSNSWGTLFSMTVEGSLTTIHSFDRYNDGAVPWPGVIQASDGFLYGTALQGGDQDADCINGCGTIFRSNKQGTTTTKYAFALRGLGYGPVAGLVQASDGNLYGTTQNGGNFVNCGWDGCGTLFRMSPRGVVTFLQLDGTDGALPQAAMIEGSDGNLYGTTNTGGQSGGGTVYSIKGGRSLVTLHSFNGSDGSALFAGLFQATDGKLYGVTAGGGDVTCQSYYYGCGTVFSIDLGLSPFVAFVRNSGHARDKRGILGQGLTGTTSVVFNRVPSSFKVISDTYLVATVPPGATSGYVTVTTQTGTLTSNKKFVVLP